MSVELKEDDSHIERGRTVQKRKVESGRQIKSVSTKIEFDELLDSPFCQSERQVTTSFTELEESFEPTVLIERSLTNQENKKLEVFFETHKIRLRNNSELRGDHVELLKNDSWLTDEVLDFFTSYHLSTNEPHVSFMSCLESKRIEKWISRKQAIQPSKKRKNIQCVDDLQGVVGYLNWNNTHWGVICYHVETRKIFFFESDVNFSLSGMHFQIFQTHLLGLGFAVQDLSFGSVTRLKGPVQNDTWSCGWLSYWVIYHLRFYFKNIHLSSKLEVQTSQVRELFFEKIFKMIFEKPSKDSFFYIQEISRS